MANDLISESIANGHRFAVWVELLLGVYLMKRDRAIPAFNPYPSELREIIGVIRIQADVDILIESVGQHVRAGLKLCSPMDDFQVAQNDEIGIHFRAIGHPETAVVTARLPTSHKLLSAVTFHCRHETRSRWVQGFEIASQNFTTTDGAY